MDKTLLTGKPYDKSDNTDIRRLFRRIRKQQKEQADQRTRDLDEARVKVSQIKQKARA